MPKFKLFSFISAYFWHFLPNFMLFFLVFCLWPLTPLNIVHDTSAIPWWLVWHLKKIQLFITSVKLAFPNFYLLLILVQGLCVCVVRYQIVFYTTNTFLDIMIWCDKLQKGGFWDHLIQMAFHKTHKKHILQQVIQKLYYNTSMQSEAKRHGDKNC